MNAIFKQVSLWSVVMIVLVSSGAKAERWDGYNDPGMMDVAKDYQYNFNKLPLVGRLDTMPWSETYWPTIKGSINYRWNSPVKDGFNYTPPSKAEVMTMSQDQLAQLAPTEKYDIFMGHYDYPLWEEARSYGNPRAKDWNGMCDGWSISALQYAEPSPVVMTNPDGVKVPFGSSDVKGLMTFTAAVHFDAETKQVGSKCEGGLRRGSAACADINAGALHVILANQIGIKKQGFVTERDPGKEIWNQPTFGFNFTVLGSAQSNAGDHGVRVHAQLWYTDELDNSSWSPVVGTPNFKSDKIEMDYVLDLDQNDNIIGGSYLRGSDHPDFVWMAVNKLTFTDTMAGINLIYKPAKLAPLPHGVLANY